MSGYTQSKWLGEFVTSVYVRPHTKNQTHISPHSRVFVA